MAFPFSDDHLMLRESAQGWLSDWYDGGKKLEQNGQAAGRAAADDWQGFAVEQGFATVAIDEAYGGAGLGRLGAVVLLEETGRVLFNAPFAASAAATVELVSRLGDEALKASLLPRLAAGAVGIILDGRDTLSFAEGKISGACSRCLDTELADFYLIAIAQGEAVALFEIAANAPGLSAEAETRVDISKYYAGLRFDGVAAAACLSVAAQDFQRALIIARGCFAVEAVGAAQQCLDLVLDYGAQRVQFGRAIASYQAIKHRCADLFIEIETARSACYMAAAAEDEAEAYEAALIAEAYARTAFYNVAADAIQLHGGIGFTWDYPLHYFFKRARALLSQNGEIDAAYDALADILEAAE